MKKWFGRRFKKNILVLGSDGMLGHDVYEHFKALSEQAGSEIGEVTGLDVKDGIKVDEDIFSGDSSLGAFFRRSIWYDFCINCVAYTNTAAAEKQDEGYYDSYRLNALAPKYIARACAERDTKLIHVSTDYVFSQHSLHGAAVGNSTYGTYDEQFPCNMYGLHKLLGEQFVKDEMQDNYAILRTSWLYGAHNHKSFIHKFVRNVVKALNEGKTEIEMTSNEVSIPTCTSTVIDCMTKLVCDKWVSGTMHAVPFLLEEEQVSRCDFAQAILLCLQLFTNGCDFTKVTLVHVERNLLQPTWSPMHSCFSMQLPYWRDALTEFMKKNGQEIVDWAIKQCNTVG